MPSPQLTPVSTLVLSLLLEEPLHPYEVLSRLVKRRDDRLVRASAGVVYRAVERLEEAGLVVEHGSDREGNRPERTIYAITDAGRRAHAARTRELLADRVREYPAFPVGLALIHDLDATDAADCLRRRRDDLDACVVETRERVGRVIAEGLPPRFVLDVLFELHQLQSEAAWLASTIADIETGALSWTDSPSGRFHEPRHTPADKETPQ